MSTFELTVIGMLCLILSNQFSETQSVNGFYFISNKILAIGFALLGIWCTLAVLSTTI